MNFYSGKWWRMRADICNEREFCAADNLTLKNEFEPEPKTGNDSPRNAGLRNESVAQKTKREWRTGGDAVLPTFPKKNRYKTRKLHAIVLTS